MKKQKIIAVFYFSHIDAKSKVIQRIDSINDLQLLLPSHDKNNPDVKYFEEGDIVHLKDDIKYMIVEHEVVFRSPIDKNLKLNYDEEIDLSTGANCEITYYVKHARIK